MIEGMKALYAFFVFSFLFLPAGLHADKADDTDRAYTLAIEGETVFELETLYDAIGADYPAIWQFWKDKKVRIDERLVDTVDEALRGFYDSEGYFDAQIDIKKSAERLYVRIDAQNPVKIVSVKIDSDFPVGSIVRLKKGQRFRPKAFKQIKAEIIKALLARGYCSYDLDTKAYVDLDRKTAELVYRIKKGGICRFGETTFQGLERIDPKVLMTRVRAKKGERFDPKKIEQTYNDLYALECFETLKVAHNRKLFNVVPIDISASEIRLPYHVELGAGYDTFVGARVHATIDKRNLSGNAEKGKLRLGWSQKERWVLFDLFKPALLIPKRYAGIDGGVEGGYSDLEYPGFREKRRYLKGYLQYLAPETRLRVGLGLERIAIDQTDAARLLQAVREGEFNLFYPFVSFIRDRRNDKLNPTEGYYVKGELEYGLNVLGGASEYLKTFLEFRYIERFRSLIAAGVLKGGVVDEKRNHVPESKRFFAGGAYSNRAYGYRSIGVILSPTQDTINGGATWLNASLELDFPIRQKFYGAVFTDYTMLNANPYDFSGEAIVSAGVGLRYMTPVGPFKIDVGFNVNDPALYGITFQIGQSF